MTETIIRKRINKASLKNMPVLQNGPPLVRFARRISSKDLSAMAIFLTALGAFSWGMCKVAQGIKPEGPYSSLRYKADFFKHLNLYRALEEENYAASCYILPNLQSGEDATCVCEMFLHIRMIYDEEKSVWWSIEHSSAFFSLGFLESGKNISSTRQK